MKKTDGQFFVFTMHERYLAMAFKAYSKYLELDKELKKYRNHQDYLGFAMILEPQKSDQLTITVIFSALCLEAFINHYAISNLKRPYFDNYIERLRINQKWMIVPQLVTGKSFKMESHEMAKLKSLFKMRDSLVHYKTCTFENLDQFIKDNKKKHFVTPDKAKFALSAVPAIIKGLHKLDPKVELDWITIEALVKRIYPGYRGAK